MARDRFAVRELSLPPGRPLPYDPADWEDGLVVVVRGVLVAEGRDGERWRFGRGAVLWLGGLPFVALHAGACRDPLLRLRVITPRAARRAPSRRPPAPPSPPSGW